MRPALKRLTAVLALTCLSAVGPARIPAAAAVQLPAGFVNDTIFAGLNQPTSFAFLPDGRLFVTEQHTGKVRLIVNGHVAATDPALVVPNLAPQAQERGLLGIAVDPAWPIRPFVYLYYNHTGDVLSLVRYTASGSLTDSNAENLTLGSERVLIDDISDQTIYHQAGCLRFGPDGMLYVSLGDDAFDCLAYDVTSLHGAILRLQVSTIPPGAGPQVARSTLTPLDNPFVGNASDDAKLVYAYGLRNPFRFQLDPSTGTIYCGDVGEDTYEEMDEIHAGNFMGWPYREANLVRELADCPEPGGPGATPYVGPIAFFGRDTDPHAIISGGMYRPVAGGTHNWPLEYYPNRGDVFYTDYYTGDLRRITWDGAEWVPAAAVAGQPDPDHWAIGFLTASDFQVGPDGSLYWMAQFDDQFAGSSGGVYRIRYTGTTSVGPAAAIASALRASPNPFSRAVELSTHLAAAEHVKLAVFDLSGRQVATLFDGDAPAGELRSRWNGQDARGTRARAGIYFARLERSGSSAPITVRVLYAP